MQWLTHISLRSLMVRSAIMPRTCGILISSPSARIRRDDTGARGRGSRNLPQQPRTAIATAGHNVSEREWWLKLLAVLCKCGPPAITVMPTADRLPTPAPHFLRSGEPLFAVPLRSCLAHTWRWRIVTAFATLKNDRFSRKDGKCST